MDSSSVGIVPYLAHDEQGLWCGESRRGMGGPQMTLGIILLVVFLGFSVIMFVAVALISAAPARTGSAYPQVFLILPVFFLIIGLAVGLPLVIVGRQLARGQYFVTSRSAIIFTENRWLGRRLTVVPLRHLPLLTLNENRDGSGSLIFALATIGATGAGYQNGMWSGGVPAFWNIDQPRDVYFLIRRQMDGAEPET